MSLAYKANTNKGVSVLVVGRVHAKATKAL